MTLKTCALKWAEMPSLLLQDSTGCWSQEQSDALSLLIQSTFFISRPILLKTLSPLGATGITGSNTGGTDHLSFDAVGIPAFQFIQDPLDYDTRTHHSNMDVYDHLSIDDLKQAGTIIATFVYNTAMRKEMLPRKPLPNPEPFLFENGYVK